MITPMLAVAERTAPPIESLDATHTFDLKLDGVRAMLHWDGTRCRLFNRNGVDVTDRFPDVVETFLARPGTRPVILDGEIIAHDLSFESIQLRDRQVKPAAIARMRAEIPVKFVAFDILQLDDRSLLTEIYTTRRRMLEDACNGGFDLTITSDSRLMDICKTRGLEGVIAKRDTSTYQPGRRSPDWIKFKCTYRVSCVPVGYEAGTGSRAHFGAMHLAMIGESGPVIVGRVGTGFNAREIDELKKRLDRRELFVVEIECANRTKGDQLRFPVYKGIRSDLSPADATTVQLASLPTC